MPIATSRWTRAIPISFLRSSANHPGSESPDMPRAWWDADHRAGGMRRGEQPQVRQVGSPAS